MGISRTGILRFLYNLFPFNLTGDLKITNTQDTKDISCIINFYGRINLLEGIIYSLIEQDISKERFEVLLIEDRGGTKEGREMAYRFRDMLDIRYYALTENFGMMGYSRNFGISKAKGRYILFLDDDTVIIQRDFLSKLIIDFEAYNADAVIPFGCASYCIINGKYSFHDSYFPTNRCMAYTRDVLYELGGFVSEIIGQEDVEFTIRFIASKKRYHESKSLSYYHPPLILNNLNKPKAVGVSFVKLKKRYPFVVWIALIINGIRFLPLTIFPLNLKWRNQAKFSFGFLLGVINGVMGRRVGYT